MINEEMRKQVVAYRLDNARNTIQEIPIHITHELWNTAINRLYYACFYAVSALLINSGIEAQTHGGVRRMLSLHFTKSGKLPVKWTKFYTDLFENRQTGDYEDFIYYDRETVEEIYKDRTQSYRALSKKFGKLLNNINSSIYSINTNPAHFSTSSL